MAQTFHSTHKAYLLNSSNDPVTRPTCMQAVLRGGGRHAAVTWELIAPFYDVIYVWDDSAEVMSRHPLLRSLPQFQLNSTEVECFDCFVAVGSSMLRMKLYESVLQLFKQNGKRTLFPTVVHASAIISPTAQIGSGCFIGPLAVINTKSRLGDFCLVNSAAIIEHDSILNDFATVSPGSIVLGGAVMETLSTLGSNATIRENRSVVAEATVGMGAAVVCDVNGPTSGFWAGVPAKMVLRHASPTPGDHITWCIRKSFSVTRFHQYLQESLERGQLTNDGPLQTVLQSKVKSLVRSNRRVLLCCNGTAALHALAAGLEIKRGSHIRWVTQAFTFPSSIQGPLADALVCDIDTTLRGPCMAFLNDRKNDFDGIIVTNVFGLLTDLLVYAQWCVDNGKLLIFDNAATPVGFVDDGRSIHDVGDGAFISFHETKPFGRGEGGAIFVGADVAPFVHQAMNFGYDISNQVRIPNRFSSNWRMSDFAAAVICDHIDTIKSEKWEEKLIEMARLATLELDKRGLQLAFPIRFPTILSCLFVRTSSETAEATCKRLNSHGIEAKNYYCPLVGKSDAPNAWKLYESTICLPFHLGISRQQLVKMIHLI